MAKKVAKTRVFHIANKIGVGSKDIVEKCKSEGIPDITGHMSAVSAGLEATIIEWFSEDGSTSSAVETAKKVNVTMVNFSIFATCIAVFLGTIRRLRREGSERDTIMEIKIVFLKF